MAAAMTRAAATLLKSQSLKHRKAAIADFAARYAAQLPEGFDCNALALVVWEKLQKDGCTDDKPKPGRKRVASEGAVGRMLNLFLKGKGTGKEWCGYTSFAQALYQNAAIKAQLDHAAIKQDQMWLRMKEEYKALYGKQLKPIVIYQKPMLQDKHKKARMHCAKTWLEEGEEALQNRVFFDEKKGFLRPGGKLRCYAPADTKSYIRESDKELNEKGAFKYAAAVAGFCGAVHLQLVTGTTGLNKGYKVRTCVPLRRHPDPARAGAARMQLPCFTDDLHLLWPILLCNAQHVKAICSCLHADVPVCADLTVIALLAS